MVKLFFLTFLLSGSALAIENSFCPRLEGKRSGTCRSERAASGCVPGMPCSPGPILVCEEESTFDQPNRNGGTCVAMEDQCTVTPEGRKCEQVCTKWSPATCSMAKAPCCVRYKILDAVPHTCCDGACRPTTVSGVCGPPPPIPLPGKKLPLCGANGGC